MISKVLVTGANGQLGRTVRELYERDTSIDFVFTTKQELDITQNQRLETFFENSKFDYCINCVAYTNVEQAELHPDLAFKVNTEGVKNIARECKKHEVVLIHISTDYVFDGKKQTPYVEDDVPNPINQYGKSKMAGETYIREILEKYFIVRTSWLYSKYGNNFLKTIIRKIKDKEQLQITTSQRGTPTSCSDLSEFIVYLIKNKTSKFGIYNFSALGETTWYGYAMEICKHFSAYDCKKIIPVNTFTSRVKRPDYSILDNTKTARVFKTKILWQKSVNKTVNALIGKH